MTETLRVLAALELIGLAAAPIAVRVLARVPGGGAGFAKVVGLLIVAWIVWIAGSLGIPNGLGVTIGAAAALAVAGALVHRFGRVPPPDDRRRRHWIAAELVFAGCFLAAALFIAYSPDVWNTEKPMDMAFVNATLQAESFPPHDPWMAGEDLNYYYFGHLVAGVLIRLTDVEPTAGYNVVLAAVFALAAACALSLGAAIAEAARRRGLPVRRPLVAGGAATVLVLLVGNLRGGGKAIGHDGALRTFDWFGPSRVTPDTINEFPFFSLLVQDLHAHVIVLPFTLLVLAFVVQLALAGPGRSALELLCASLAFGSLYAINSWTWPIAAGLLALAVVAWSRDPAAQGRRKAPAAWAIAVLGAGILLFLPFILNFDPNARGIGIVERREGFGLFMRHNLLIYGGLVWLVAALYAGRLRAAEHPFRVVVWGGAGLVFALSLLAPAELAGAGLVMALLLVALHALLSPDVPGPERVLWILVAGGMACVVGPELFYIRDEFDETQFFRMNTVFKLGYHAWILLALAGGVALAAAASWLPRVPRWLWRAGALAGIAIGLAYTVAGSYARKDAFAASPTLDGRRWLERSAPGDVAAIEWLRENAAGDDVVLEAVGDAYSAFGHARISTYTGRPTVLGWPGHEIQWSHAPGTRREDVRAIYTAADPAPARALLERYRVSFAVIGPIERTDYGEAPVLAGLGRKVFEAAGTAVYALPFGATAPPAGEPPPRRALPPLGR